MKSNSCDNYDPVTYTVVLLVQGVGKDFPIGPKKRGI